MKNKMKKEVCVCEGCCNCTKNASNGCGGAAGAIYGLGFIGAAIYYIQQAPGFWAGVVGILKAAVWPAFLIHKLLGF